MFKKVLAVVLSMVLVVSLGLLFASAQPVGESSPAELQFREDGTFHILQIADIQDAGILRGDIRRFLHEAIQQEQPDLIVLTGDNIRTSQGVRRSLRAISQFMRIFEHYGIPVAVTFGNHDATNNATKVQQMEHYNSYRVSLMRSDFSQNLDDPTAATLANFYLPIRSSCGQNPYAFNLWFFDLEGTGAWRGIPDAVLDWYRETSNALAAANGGELVPSIVFQHIPPIEIWDYLDYHFGGTEGSQWRQFGGFYTMSPDPNYPVEWNFMDEHPCPANTGDYLRGQFDVHLDQGDVLMIVVGHCHANNFRVNWQGIDIMNTGGINPAPYPIPQQVMRTITIHEDRANTCPRDIETRTLAFANTIFSTRFTATWYNWTLFVVIIIAAAALLAGAVTLVVLRLRRT